MARRGKNRGAVKDLGRSIIKFDGGDSPTVLVTSHRGFFKDFNIMLVDELGCSKCAGWEWWTVEYLPQYRGVQVQCGHGQGEGDTEGGLH